MIDSDLEITFLPRTLYELMLIRECIEEDLREGEICEGVLTDVQRLLHYPKFKSSIYGKSLGLLGTPHQFDSEGKTKEEKMALRERLRKYMQARNCWHICCFDDAGDEKTEEVKTIAFRINQVAVKKLPISTIGHLSYQKISQLVEQELDYFRTYFQNAKKIWKERRKGKNTSMMVRSGPAVSFAAANDCGTMATGICDDNQSRIIRNVIALECSQIARKAFFIYRGAQIKMDSNLGHSLSYGTSLFAGIMFDVNATAYHFMRKAANAAFAVQIPFEKIKESPFYVPLTHPICQIFGIGELFHARSKVGNDFDTTPSGIMQSDSRWKEILRGTQTYSELGDGFKRYYSKNVVFLK